MRAAFARLEEARILLSVIGARAVHRMSWAQSVDPSFAIGFGTGTLISQQGIGIVTEHEINAEEAEELASAYFEISEDRRRRTLHVPLYRLDRAIGDREITDRVIDVGIALEALLLHEQQADRGELKFRLSLRGAWLKGENVLERQEIFRLLKRVYDLRSRAVHTGLVDANQDNRETVQRAVELCRQLVRKVIDLGTVSDWDELVLGR